ADDAAVQFNQVPHDREAETESAVCARRRAVSLAEAFEHVRQKLWRDPRASIADADLRVRAVLRDVDTNHAAIRGELRSCGEQVPNYLLQTVAVAGEYLEIALIVRVDPDLLRVKRRPDSIEGGVHD